MTIDLGFAWIDLPLYDDDAAGTGRDCRMSASSTFPATSILSRTCWPASAASTPPCWSSPRMRASCPRRVSIWPSSICWPCRPLVVALTKVDLIDDPEWLDLVELDVVELLQDTHLASAPIVRVSAMSGEGLDESAPSSGEDAGHAAAPSQSCPPSSAHRPDFQHQRLWHDCHRHVDGRPFFRGRCRRDRAERRRGAHSRPADPRRAGPDRRTGQPAGHQSQQHRHGRDPPRRGGRQAGHACAARCWWTSRFGCWPMRPNR